MVDIQSKEVIDKMSEDLKVQPAMMLPRLLGNQIMPTFSVNSDNIITAGGLSDASVRTATGNLNAFTTPVTTDFFLTNITAGFVKDATCDVGTGGLTISCVIGGRTTTLYAFPVITLTADGDHIELHFSPPIKLDRNTTVLMAGAFTVGVMSRSLHTAGFIKDPQ